MQARKILSRSNGRRWRIVGAMLFVVLAGVVLLSLVAMAGEKERFKKGPEKAQYVHKNPPMSFLRGRLARDINRGWMVDNVTVWFSQECTLTDYQQPERTLSPREGQEIFLAGQRIGGSFIVRRGFVLPASLIEGAPPTDSEYFRPSSSDPRVGESYGPE
jgi:hypothetical protein